MFRGGSRVTRAIVNAEIVNLAERTSVPHWLIAQNQDSHVREASIS